MKKSLVVKLLSALLIVVLIFSLASCGNDDADDYLEDDVNLSAKAELKVKKAYLILLQELHGDKVKGKTVDDINIKHYLGNYDGSLAVVMLGDAWTQATVIGGVEVGGVKFTYCGEQIRIYKSGRLYVFNEAYDRGFLTKADVESIADKYRILYPEYMNR